MDVEISAEEQELFSEVASDLAFALHSIAKEEDSRVANVSLAKQKSLVTLTGKIAKIGGWEMEVSSRNLIWTSEVANIHGISQGVEPSFDVLKKFYKDVEWEKFNIAIDTAINKGDDFELELEMKTSRKENKWIRMSGYPVVENSSIVKIFGTFQDITDKKQMEVKLRQREKMDAIGQLAGGVAHDFNNQLAGIMGYADMLLNKIHDKKLSSYAEKILLSSKRAADLTNQLLAFSRKGKYLSVPTDLHSTVAEVVALLKHSIDKRINIKQVLVANPSVVVGDPSQLQNAILNLALNARDAMPEGGEIVFSTRIADLTQNAFDFEVEEGRYVELCISDTGCGMSKEVQKHIFEPFFTTKEQGKGTGLGLASVFGTIKNHKGAMTVYSEPDMGTTFRIYLPSAENAGMEAVSSVEKITEVVEGARILIVDDEEVVCDFATDMLRDLSYKVTAFVDPQKALTYYKQSYQHIDLVILDMVMPGMSGRELFVAMRSVNPDIKALLSSGYSIEGEAQNIIDEGVLGFVQKPYQVAELSSAVYETIAGE
jgi:signal transduction histidine kinase/ActR/RegA family two-component response regulator